MPDILDSNPSLTEVHIDHTASTIDHNYPAVLQSNLFFILQELHHSYITSATIRDSNTTALFSSNDTIHSPRLKCSGFSLITQ